MAARPWRMAYASVIGTSHVKSDMPCQDAGLCRPVTALDGEEVLVAAVSDGAGTASRSEVGASLAVASFIKTFTEAATMRSDLTSIDRTFALKWLEGLKASIGKLAQAEGLASRDYACTILGAVIGPSTSVFMQVGDGAIVVAADDGKFDWVFWPQHGEFANQTNFVIQDRIEEVLDFETSSGRVEEIALFSDGIERLVLDIANQSVHSPSFRPIFDWLAGTEPVAPTEPSGALAAYLGSDHINRRTDDDKTLVMATRSAPPASGA